MKNFILTISLCFCLNGYSQTLTKKYNSLNNRYEYFDSQNVLIGYQFYDTLDKSWKYYEIPKKQNRYIYPINTNLVNQALSAKQSRYDYNISKIDETIDDIGNNILELDLDESKIQVILNKFNNSLDKLSKSKPNYSSTSVTQNIINWLYSEANNIIGQEDSFKAVEKTKSVQTGRIITLKRKAVIWDIPNIVKAKSIGEMQNYDVYIIEKTNDQFYKIKCGNIIGYITAVNIE